MEVYLIGNGFDLDLGINSSYSTYYTSKYFVKLKNDENNHVKDIESGNNITMNNYSSIM